MTLKEDLQDLLDRGPPGWERKAAHLIARGFYGNWRGMIGHYIAMLKRLEADQDGRETEDRIAAIVAGMEAKARAKEKATTDA